jgi:Raf kinase inhibitor-like YbhB/YbcL family protein
MLGPLPRGFAPRHGRRSRRAAGGVIALVIAVALVSCNDDGRQLRAPEFPPPAPTTAPPTTIDPNAPPVATAAPVTAAPLQLVAPWVDGGQIPARHTCDGDDATPALSWANIPAGTAELALSFTDIDAGFTHWVMPGLNAARATLAEGEIPPEAVVRTNDFGEAAWAGPCPPPDEAAHTYLITVHALNQQVEVADDAATDDVISLLNQTVLAQSSISGTYARAG